MEKCGVFVTQHTLTTTKDFQVPPKSIFKKAVGISGETDQGHFKKLPVELSSIPDGCRPEQLYWDFDFDATSFTVTVLHSLEVSIEVECILQLISREKLCSVIQTCEVRTMNPMEFEELEPKLCHVNSMGFFTDDFGTEIWKDFVDTFRIILTLSICSSLKHVMLNTPIDELTESASVSPPKTLTDASVSYFMSKAFSDTVIFCGGEEWPAHKFILASSSEIFTKLFQEVTPEESGIKIESDKPEAIKEMLRFMYTGAFDHTQSDLLPHILQAAHKYEVEELQLSCVSQMVEKISFDNAAMFYKTGEQYGQTRLTERAMDFIKTNKEEFFKDQEALKELTQTHPTLMLNLFLSK